jgi:triacylglycerol esterase/lipase EstA (alpha/beta hydrolase family)
VRRGSLPEAIAVSLAEAANLIDLGEAQVFAHWQTFPSTAGPFRGIGGAAMTEWPVVLVVGRRADEGGIAAACYAGGREVWKAIPDDDKLTLILADAASRKLRMSALTALSRYAGAADSISIHPALRP